MTERSWRLSQRQGCLYRHSPRVCSNLQHVTTENTPVIIWIHQPSQYSSRNVCFVILGPFETYTIALHSDAALAKRAQVRLAPRLGITLQLSISSWNGFQRDIQLYLTMLVVSNRE